MKKSSQLISMPVVSLEEGKQVGVVKSLVIHPINKSLAAFILEQKGWFKEERIIPYAKIHGIGNDAVTIESSSSVQKPTNLPEILQFIKEDFKVSGSKVMTENGSLLGYVDDFWLDTEGKICQLDLSGKLLNSLLKGKARLPIEAVKTIGENIIITNDKSPELLEVIDGGLQETVKNLKESSTNLIDNTWQKTLDLSKNISKKFEKDKVNPRAETVDFQAAPPEPPSEPPSDSPSETPEERK